MNDIVVVSFQSLTVNEVAGPGKLGFHLAKELHEIGRLSKFVVSSKGKYETSFPSAPVSFLSRYYLFLLNHIWKAGLIPYYWKRYLEEELFDFFLSFRVNSNVKILVTINPYLSRTLRQCKRLNIKTILIPANPEESEINRVIKRAKAQWSIPDEEIDVYSFSNRVKKYDVSLLQFDKVVTHTSLIQESFLKRIKPEKIEPCIGLIWSAHQNNVPKSCKDESVFKVAYLAHTVLLKGLQDLLEAWSALSNTSAELHIGGQIDPLVQQLIDKRFTKLQNVFYHGPVTNADGFFSGVSLFICPSLIDAVPITVLEAGARGIPSIISSSCGVKDFVLDGQTGFITPPMDADKLKDKLDYCIANPKIVTEMGNGMKDMLSKYSFQKFVHSLTKLVLSR